jgi:WD40 repeat protein
VSRRGGAQRDGTQFRIKAQEGGGRLEYTWKLGTQAGRGFLDKEPDKVVITPPPPPDKPVPDAGYEALGWGGVNGLAFTPDGKQLVSSSWTKAVRVMNLADEKIARTIEADAQQVTCSALSADGKLLATGGLEKVVKVWDLESGKLLQTLKGHNRWTTAVAISPDGKLVAVGEDQATRNNEPKGVVKIWEVESGKEVASIPDEVLGLAFSPDSKLLATTGGWVPNTNQRVVRVWTVKGKIRFSLPGHQKGLYRVAFSPDGKFLASAGEEKEVGLWDMKTGGLKHTLRGTEGYVHALAFTPDGKALVFAGESGTVRVWDPEKGKEIASSKEQEFHGIAHIAFSPDGKRMAVDGDKGIKVVDVPAKP